jgi:hypothetical protein
VLLQLQPHRRAVHPFISEAIYRNLRTADMPESVHLCDFPTADGARRDPALEARDGGGADRGRWAASSAPSTTSRCASRWPGREVEIGPDDILIERIPKDGLAVAAEGELVVGLETALSPDLRREGLAREIVSRIQNLRKTRDYEVTQRIRVRYWGNTAVREAIAAHRDYIAAETLCTACEESADAERGGDADTVNGSPLHLWVGTDPA